MSETGTVDVVICTNEQTEKSLVLKENFVEFLQSYLEDRKHFVYAKGFISVNWVVLIFGDVINKTSKFIIYW